MGRGGKRRVAQDNGNERERGEPKEDVVIGWMNSTVDTRQLGQERNEVEFNSEHGKCAFPLVLAEAVAWEQCARCGARVTQFEAELRPTQVRDRVWVGYQW